MVRRLTLFVSSVLERETKGERPFSPQNVSVWIPSLYSVPLVRTDPLKSEWFNLRTVCSLVLEGFLRVLIGNSSHSLFLGTRPSRVLKS